MKELQYGLSWGLYILFQFWVDQRDIWMIHGSYICNERLLALMQASRVAAGETGRFSRISVGEHEKRILGKRKAAFSHHMDWDDISHVALNLP